MKQFYVGLVIAMMLAGCASSGHRAPVVERSVMSSKKSVTAKRDMTDWRPKVHVVKKGDTLFAIAFDYGLDPHELAEQNHIPDPNQIQVGQIISLFPSATAVSTAALPAAMPVESKPLQPLVKDQPVVVKYAYSEAAVAKVEAAQNGGTKAERQVSVRSETVQPVKAGAVTEPKAGVEAEPVNAKPQAAPDAQGDNAIEWSMPTRGKVINGFSEADNRKGIDIAGKLGQPIYASAPGKVVYSGTGLRGYGKLLIIKHNATYLSAYAHNDKMLVKEGETVTRGQKIAEMGNSDSDQVKLHFEVRRLGKPVDPADYLPLGKP